MDNNINRHYLRVGATKKRHKSGGRKFDDLKNMIPSIPNWGSFTLGLFIGIILTSVVFFYFSTSDITLKIPAKASGHQSAVPAQKTVNPALKSGKSKHLQTDTNIATKQIPEPRFDFYTELTKNSNETNTQKPSKPAILDLKSAPMPIHKYLVQAGSFKNRDDADALKAKLTLNGLDAKIQIAQLGGELWHRVVVGPYKNEALAVEQKHLLSALDLNDAVILKSN
jgi:cell division protein FtsN